MTPPKPKRPARRATEQTIAPANPGEIRLSSFVEAWNAAQGQTTPRLHLDFIEWLEQRWIGQDRRLLLMAFRGSGKSTILGLFAAWMLRRNPNLRILVLAADLALAKKMVRTVKRIIERHSMTGCMKPPKLDQWAGEQFTVVRPMELRDPSMLARGVTTNLTGSRADLIICDDVEVPNTCSTPPRRADLRDRLRELSYVLTPDGTHLYVGTPHTYHTIYADQPRPEMGENEPFLDGFMRLVRPVWDAPDIPAWPERFPPDAIKRIQRHTGPNRFASQMMLQPVSASEGRLNPDLLRPYDGEIEYRTANGMPHLSINGIRMLDASCWWDPSIAAAGQTDRSGDSSVVVAVYIDAEGCYWLHRVLYLTVDPAEKERGPQQQCQAVARFVEDLHLPAITIETNGVGALMPLLLRQEIAKLGGSCTVEKKASGKGKAERIIEALDAPLAAGRIHAHRGIWDTGLMIEMREWRPSGRNKVRDDGLDALAGAIANKPTRIGAGPRAGPRKDWRPGAQSHQAVIDFTVF